MLVVVLLLSVVPSPSLCIPFFFWFLTGLIFRNPLISTDYFQFRGTHIGIKSFKGKNNVFWNPTEFGIRPEFRGEGPLQGATCNKHTAGRLKNHNKSRCQRWHSAATAPCHKPLCHATVLPCCRHYCHCLSRGSSNGAGMAVCGGGSGSSSGSGGGGAGGVGSGAILLLVIVLILLLLLSCCVAAPHLHQRPCCLCSSPLFSFSLLWAPCRQDHCPPSTRARACPQPGTCTRPYPCCWRMSNEGQTGS